jgi:hypothetical protein
VSDRQGLPASYDADISREPVDPVETLIQSWRKRADQGKARADRLGNCTAGGDAFTLACTLRDCAQQLEDVYMKEEPA